MKPAWIINFSRKEPFGSFFDTYWQASVYNDREQQLTDSDKWFYCYDAAADSVSYEQLYQTARQLTADLSDSQPRLIANLAGCFGIRRCNRRSHNKTYAHLDGAASAGS